MKKVILIFILLFILFSFLSAEDAKKEENGITFWEVIGIILILFIFAVVIFFTLIIGSQGTFDSGNILVRKGEKINLELNPFSTEEKEKVTFGILIKEITGNKITFQCKICKEGKILLTKIIGVERGKKVTTQIKKILNYPVEISARSSNKDQMGKYVT